MYKGIDKFCDNIHSITEKVCKSIATNIDAAIRNSSVTLPGKKYLRPASLRIFWEHHLVNLPQ